MNQDFLNGFIKRAKHYNCSAKTIVNFLHLGNLREKKASNLYRVEQGNKNRKLDSDGVKNHLFKVLEESHKIHPHNINLNSNYAHDLGFDELDSIEHVMNLEDDFQFKHELPDEALEKVHTVGDMHKLLLHHLKNDN